MGHQAHRGQGRGGLSDDTRLDVGGQGCSEAASRGSSYLRALMDLVLYLLVPLLIEIPTTTFDFLACCRFYGRFVTFQILTVASPPALATLPPSTQLM